MEDVKLGKRYKFAMTIPSDDRYKDGLVSSIDNKGIATLLTKSGEVWLIPVDSLEQIKK